MKYRVKIVDNKKNEINILEDEILEIKYDIGVTENSNFANNRSVVSMEIKGKIISNIIDNSEKEKDLYTHNKENVIKLIEWADSYLKENDYRNVEIFLDLGSEKNIEYNFFNMFVFNFSQELSIEKGIGIFTLTLKQKFHQESKVKVK